jgi:hypothetical protein
LSGREGRDPCGYHGREDGGEDELPSLEGAVAAVDESAEFAAGEGGTAQGEIDAAAEQQLSLFVFVLCWVIV